MIAGLFHQGSGLGNQLHRYVATRVLALDKGYDFAMLNQHMFKGYSFLDLEMGDEKKALGTPTQPFTEKKITENGVDIRGYDPEINFVEDNTVLDGEFQDPRYFEHRLAEIRQWLTPKNLSGFYDKVCVIAFRGGEYKSFPDLYLPKEYWDKAVSIMKEKGLTDEQFLVVTDDPEEASRFFPKFRITHEIGDDWCSILVANYLILSNSSFPILPALLNQNAELILAPRYWARYNTKTWSMNQNYYKQFKYI